MEQNKGFWYADWSFPIFVGLLSSGVFAGTHMYYLYASARLTKLPSWRC
ncbi:Putative inner membrane protein [Enterobacter hormaechei]|nr:Putative inner membrane protein [Enterobacter hormaechei]